ncbi:hypothetical protein NW752_012112 [Fusarium irregulare]|uniref:Uncharacterized protein n=1 Tax=Fusarium irregulare TaxID=2494466 RepID=A0A9W8PGY4_9HYPO|nr:hypothetical protein NW752_012112 [Fusarium irregulare]KAJ4006549.1 hypothetical protein NW766_010643 [Fusarium irregulare]
MSRSDHTVVDSDSFHISSSFIPITASDGSRVLVRVFPVPVPMDQLVPAWEAFPEPEPAPEPAPEPSFDFKNASLEELWARIKKQTADEIAKIKQDLEGKVKSKL